MRAIIGAALLPLTAAVALAQDVARVSIAGSVRDVRTGEAVAGAEIRLVGRDTLRVVSDAEGGFRAAARHGAYEAHVRALGYRAHRDSVSPGTGPVAFVLTPLPLALDRIVVTAARREQKLADVVVTTEVLSRADIERSGASDLAGALSFSTGVEMDAGVAGGVGPMLQGLGSSRVLVLLDGQPLPGRIAGEFDISRIPTAIVERVEIVKGPQSTLYGSEAMGGVVNVITRTPDPDRRTASVSVTAGANNHRDASVSMGAALGDIAMRGDVGRRSIERTPGRAEQLGALAERLDGAARLRWRRGAATLESTLLALDERQRFLSGGIYHFADNEQVTGQLAAEWSGPAAQRVRAAFHASSYDHLSRAGTLPQPIRGDTGQRQVQRLFQGELAATTPLGRHVLDVATQVRVDEAESVRVPGGRRSVTTIEPLAQLDAAVTSRLSVVSGVRVSSSNRWGTRSSPRLAVRYRPWSSFTLRASGGTGFRAPDFRELYMRFVNQSAGYAVFGNEQLRPEYSRNASLGAEWVRDAGFVRAQLFWNEFRDFIETRAISAPGDAPLYEYGNVAAGFTRGMELEGAAWLHRLRADAGYTLLETADRATRQPLLGRPRHAARASLSHPLPLRLQLSAVGVMTGRTPMQRDADGLVSSWRDAFPRLDLRLAHRLGAGAEVTLHTENVLDRRPQNWSAHTGRHVFLALKWESR